MNLCKRLRQIIGDVLGLLIYACSCFFRKNDNRWVFGAWMGEKYTDNPKCFFEYVNNNFPEIECIWLSNSRKVVETVKEKGFRAYNTYSLNGIMTLLKSGVVVIGHSISADLFCYAVSGKTLKVQLWHGIPLKKIMYDDNITANPYTDFVRKIKLLYNKILPFRREDYDLLVATSDETKKIFSGAFNISEEKVIITGYPRNDQLCNVSDTCVMTDNIIRILYAPTFRGKVGSVFELTNEFYGFNPEKISQMLFRLNAIMYIKLHPVNRPNDILCETIKSFKNIVLVSEDEDVNERLENFDLLITDYSSIFFDYLLLDRPIIFAPFDQAQYLANERDLYYSYEKVTPGEKAYNWDELMIIITENVVDKHKYWEKRSAIRNIFHKYTDGQSCKRLFEIIRLVQDKRMPEMDRYRRNGGNCSIKLS